MRTPVNNRSAALVAATMLAARIAAGSMAPAAMAQAGSPGSCSAPGYRQFDFRLGSFDVTTRSGQPAGTAQVESVLDGCLLVEYWTGALSGRGRAHYYYDSDADLWRMLFVNDEGASLIMTGHLVEGSMVFSGENRFGEFGGMHRMIWSRLPDGRIRQFWEHSVDKGGSWQVIHVGFYSPRGAADPG
jgi:hypothetical protein